MTSAIPSLTRVPATEKGLTIADFLIPVRVGERASPRIRDLALVVAGAILIFLCAQVVIPRPGSEVPYTLQTFGVLVVGGALGMRRGFLAALVYMLVGLVGVPFFAEHKGGAQVVLGATGGYIVGFILAGALVGRLAELGWDRNIIGSVGAMVIGSAAIYAVGVPWLAYRAFDGDLSQAITAGLLPFLLWDALKLGLAAIAFPAAWWFVGRRPGDR